MAIEFACSHCGRQFSVPDAAAGQRAKCKSCQQVLTIPAKSVSAATTKVTKVAKTTPPAPVAASASSDDLFAEALALEASAKPVPIVRPVSYETPVTPARKKRSLRKWMSLPILPLIAGAVPFVIMLMITALCLGSDMSRWDQGRGILGMTVCFNTWPVLVFAILDQKKLGAAVMLGVSPFGIVGIVLLLMGMGDPPADDGSQPKALVIPPASTSPVAPPAAVATFVHEGTDPTFEGEPVVDRYSISEGDFKHDFTVLRPNRFAAPRSMPCLIMVEERWDLLDRHRLEFEQFTNYKSVPGIDPDRFYFVTYCPGQFWNAAVGVRNPAAADQAQFQEYLNSDNALKNARWAIDLALKQPNINPDQIYAVGHGAGGYHALRLAAHDKRVRGCVALQPVVDLTTHFPQERIAATMAKYGDLRPLLVSRSPLADVERITCPILIGLSTPPTPAGQSCQQFLTRLKAANPKARILDLQTGYNTQLDSWLWDQGALR